MSHATARTARTPCNEVSPVVNAVKDEAKTLIDKLPDDATWDDIMYEFYVRQKIEAGLQAETDGRTAPHEEVRRRFLQK